MKSAIAKDSEGELTEAINLYCESLEYFIPIIKCQHVSNIGTFYDTVLSGEQNLQAKEELRRKVQ